MSRDDGAGSAGRAADARRWARASACALVCAAVAVSLGGCDVITSVGPKSCDRSDKTNPPEDYVDGTAVNGVYQSSPWDKNLLYFPGGMQIRLFHKLGTKPRTWQAYLAFDETGVKSGRLAAAAGNQVELVDMGTDTLTVRNGSCADYWLLVTAEAGDASAPAPTSSGN